MRIVILRMTFAVTLVVAPVHAAPVLMSADWARDACTAWNNDPMLTDKMAENGWVKNDLGRGFRVIQVYRTDCGAQPTAEMRVSSKDDKAMCVYGGAPETTKLEAESDYVLKAKTISWIEMGQAKYGPTTAMLVGQLRFDYGPKFEAMGNIGEFLLLVGKVPSDTSSCPAK